MIKSDLFVFSCKVSDWHFCCPARALLQWSSNLSVHKKHVESLIKHIAGPRPQRFWLFTWFEWGLRIYNSRGPGNARVVGDSETTALQRAIIHLCGWCLQEVSKTSDSWQFYNGHWRIWPWKLLTTVKKGYPEERSRSFLPLGECWKF